MNVASLHLFAVGIGVIGGVAINAILARLHHRTMDRLRADFRARFGEELDV